MPLELTGLNVFIASPGNLQDERQLFLSTLSEFNIDDAPESGVTFIPRGHEFAFAGAGRPQELINEQIRKSDYLIVMFWDKWGRPTSDEATYTSGTEEEYEIAVQCLADPNAPMRDVIVLFKGVNDRQLSDPGYELSRVLDFKKRLESERRVLYASFDTPDEFKTELRRHLQRWTRAWGAGEPPPKATIPPIKSEAIDRPNSEVVDKTSSVLENAILLARRGRITDAQQLFAQAITTGYNRDAFAEYARFLRKQGRYSASEQVSTRQVELARDNDDFSGEVEGLANLGIIKRLRGQKSASEKHFLQALRVVDERITDVGKEQDLIDSKAFLLDNLSLTLRKTPGRLDDARNYLEESIELRRDSGDKSGQAQTLRTLGVLSTQMGDLDAAEASLRLALRLFSEEDYERGKALTYASLGEVLEQQERPFEAETSFEDALAINVSEGNRQGRSMNLSQLSRVRLSQGKIDEARQAALACIELNEQVGDAEGLASGLHALGRVLVAEGKLSTSLEYLEQASEGFATLNQPIGQAATAVDLAQVHYRSGDEAVAAEYIGQARRILEQTPHNAIEKALDRVESEMRNG